MFIRDYISKDYPVFSGEESIISAAETAREFGFSHVFIQNDGAYSGALNHIFLEENPHGTLESLDHHLEKFAVSESASFLDTVKLFHTFGANVVPVIGQDEQYLGYIGCEDVFAEFSRYPLFSESGAVITLQVSGPHYSFTEIARIVEGSNGKIYGCFISEIHEDYLRITLKISSINLSSIDETFERYGYIVVDKSYADEKGELLKDRFGFLQKYLQL